MHCNHIGWTARHLPLPCVRHSSLGRQLRVAAANVGDEPRLAAKPAMPPAEQPSPSAPYNGNGAAAGQDNLTSMQRAGGQARAAGPQLERQQSEARGPERRQFDRPPSQGQGQQPRQLDRQRSQGQRNRQGARQQGNRQQGYANGDAGAQQRWQGAQPQRSQGQQQQDQQQQGPPQAQQQLRRQYSQQGLQPPQGQQQAAPQDQLERPQAPQRQRPRPHQDRPQRVPMQQAARELPQAQQVQRQQFQERPQAQREQHQERPQAQQLQQHQERPQAQQRAQPEAQEQQAPEAVPQAAAEQQQQQQPIPEAPAKVERIGPPKRRVQPRAQPQRPQGFLGQEPTPGRMRDAQAPARQEPRPAYILRTPLTGAPRPAQQQGPGQGQRQGPGQGQGQFRQGQGGRDQRGAGGGGPSRNGKGGRGQGQKGDLGIVSRRSARAERRQKREDRDAEGQVAKEEIFEVSAEGMSVDDLASKLAVQPGDVIKELFMAGIMAQANQVLDPDTVILAAERFEVEAILVDEEEVPTTARKDRDWIDKEDLEHLTPRPPVVTVMGHVDHGKTSLLDFIRKAKVAAGEAGGITQAIGAYTCDVRSDGEHKQITFLDTPGHEAFSAMRARGTRVTDIAVIVVAADDGVRPQTKEAISHAKAAGVPIVVAINKVDKEGAQPDRVKQELSDVGLLAEEWGGQVPMVAISAKKGTGVDGLLETLVLTAEVEELQANPEKAAAGTIIEAHLDRQKGAVATLLVQTGTLRIGDIVQTGATFGRVRSMQDNIEVRQEAGPSTAVQMVGLSSVPVAGDEFWVWPSIEEARKHASVAHDAQRTERLAEQAGGGSMITTRTLASYDDDESDGVLQRINIILKADASGSLEAVKAALSSLPQEAVALRFLLSTANDITVSDVDLAFASSGIIIGFNVEPSEAVQAAAKQSGVVLRNYKVIYDLVDDMRAAMEGRLSAVEERQELGRAEVRAVFGKGSRIVAGCMVTEGRLTDNCHVVVKRKRKTVWEGSATSLRRVKESVKSVEQGNECGLGAKGFAEWAEGDVVEAYKLVEKRRTLEDASVGQLVEA